MTPVMRTIFSKIFALKADDRDGIHHLIVLEQGLFASAISSGDALFMTLAKWVFIVQCYFAMNGVFFIYDGGHKTCALCRDVFESCSADCNLCVLHLERGVSHCANTPYEGYTEMVSLMDSTSYRFPEEDKENWVEMGKYYALAELEYLTNIALKLQLQRTTLSDEYYKPDSYPKKE